MSIVSGVNETVLKWPTSGRKEGSFGATVGAALLKTLGQGLGEDFTPATRQAWTDVYGVMTTVMTLVPPQNRGKMMGNISVVMSLDRRCCERDATSPIAVAVPFA